MKIPETSFLKTARKIYNNFKENFENLKNCMENFWKNFIVILGKLKRNSEAS